MMHAKPETWQIVSFLIVVAFIVLVLGGAIVILFIDAVLQSRHRLSSRFRRITESENLDQNELQTVAEKLGFKVVEELPGEIRAAVGFALGRNSRVDCVDCLQRQVKHGTYVLCNVRHDQPRSRTHQDGSAPTRYTDIREFTALIYHADLEVSFPAFTLLRNPTVLGIIKMFDSWRHSGPRFEEDREFHEKVLVSTCEREALFRMFTPSVRDVLKANSDLTTVAIDRLILVYDRDRARERFHLVTHGAEYFDCQIVDPRDWPQFHQAAGSVIEAIRSAHRQMLQGQQGRIAKGSDPDNRLTRRST